MVSNEIFWGVIAVGRSEDGESGFAYTTGLSQRGRPELYLWAQPTDGIDPGVDWAFSQFDQGQLLNEFAADLMAGTLVEGATFRRSFDYGEVEVDFTLAPATTAEQIGAYQLAELTPVIPIRWSLHRVAEGTKSRLDGRALTRLANAGARAARLVDRDLAAGLSFWPRDRAALAPSDAYQPYGPAGLLVRALAAQVATADARVLTQFLCADICAESSRPSSSVTARARAIARPVGRSRDVEAAHDLGHQVLERLDRAGLIDEVVAFCGYGAARRSHDQVVGVLHSAITALLTTAVVYDVADRELEPAGLGPWQYAVAGVALAPAMLWRAPKQVLNRVRAAIGDCDVHSLQRAVSGYAYVREQLTGYLACAAVLGQVYTGPFAPPEPAKWLGGTRLRGALASALLWGPVTEADGWPPLPYVFAVDVITMVTAVAAGAELSDAERASLSDIVAPIPGAVTLLQPEPARWRSVRAG